MRSASVGRVLAQSWTSFCAGDAGSTYRRAPAKGLDVIGVDWCGGNGSMLAGSVSRGSKLSEHAVVSRARSAMMDRCDERESPGMREREKKRRARGRMNPFPALSRSRALALIALIPVLAPRAMAG